MLANDDPSGSDQFRYRVGWDVNSDGKATGWDSRRTGGMTNEADGAGFEITDLDGNPERGAAVFKKNCAVCHRIGETGRVKLTTLTKEFFVPGFLERDEGEREPPFEKFPWDGVSGVRPFSRLAKATTVGVY